MGGKNRTRPPRRISKMKRNVLFLIPLYVAFLKNSRNLLFNDKKEKKKENRNIMTIKNNRCNDTPPITEFVPSPGIR